MDVDQPEDAPLVRETFCLNSLRYFVPRTLERKVFQVVVMEEGPEFEISEQELWAFAKELADDLGRHNQSEG